MQSDAWINSSHAFHGRRVSIRGAGGNLPPLESYVPPLEFGIQKKTLNIGLRMHQNASQRNIGH